MRAFILTRSLIDNPLAQGFNITQGSVNVVVPNVPPRTDYLVVCEYTRSSRSLWSSPFALSVMGDSGNASPTFAITGGSNSTVPSPTSGSTTQTSPPSTGTTTGSTSGAASTPGSSEPAPMTTAQSSPTPGVTNAFTTSGTPSSTTVVVPPTSTGASTKTSGALSMRPIGATCLSVALIISGILL